ncbi:ABC transporter substrate-binding protein [Salinadaptatus halalkaliphilus]|uniref:ABC transporter substrate-binding protein n=1 Tax=Salinadaptatus halalkaliphilus TaxID=2419781 RepID=A0A4S3TSB4_9EURY|nr:ABC transporter substrate-binding protein [Salinadaptatus halalkaliphilus]THE66590.1 ABC transporter substrate-binding protein [Salinadaptatus halalkaliphilus]
MKNAINRRSLLAGMGTAATAGVAGCLSSDDVEPDARVGVLQSITGDLSSVGGPIRDGAILPQAQLQDAGAEFELDVRVEDTETDPEAGITAAGSLVDAGYPAINGALSSGVTIAVAEDVLFPNDVVGISPASTTPSITEMDGDYLLRTCPSDAWQGEVMAEIAVEERGVDTISTLYLNDDYGQGLADTFVESFEDLGGEIYDELAFESEQPSYDSELETALASEPEMLLVVGYPDSGEQIFRDFYSEFDDGTEILVPDGLIDNDLPGAVDNPLENVVGTAPSGAGPGHDTFTDLYEAEYDSSPSVFNAEAYDATAVLLLANVAADELTGSAVSDQIREVANPDGEVVTPDTLKEGLEMAAAGESVQYQGASGDIVFDENGDLEAVVYDIYEYDMDGYTVVDGYEF